MAKKSFNRKTHLYPGWSHEDESDLAALHNSIYEDPAVSEFSAQYHPGQDTIHLSMIKVKAGYRKGGVGSRIMQRLADFADSKGKSITLQTATRDSGLGTTSQSRLGKFYRRFGFRDNYGKRDYRPDLEGDMHRPPVDRHFYDTLDEIERFTDYRSAAIYSPRTGHIFEGPIHPMAHDAAARAGHPDAHSPRLWEDGFMTHDGVFHDREGRESVDMMSKGQLPLAPEGAGDRPDIRPEKAAQLRAIHLREGGKERHSLYRSAAVKHLPTGKIIEGTWHGEAMNNAMDQGLNTLRWDDFEDGFVTHGGEYHTREEAGAAAAKKDGVPLEFHGTTLKPKAESVDLWREGHLSTRPSILDRDAEEEDDDSERHFYDTLGELERFNLYRSASIRNPRTGRMFEGTWHGDARNKAEEAGIDPGLLSFWEDGFTTHEGEFHNRDRAQQETVNASLKAGKAWSSGLNEMNMPESVHMMMAGHLPVDESMTRDPAVDEDLRKKLASHLEVDRHFYESLDEIERFSLFRSAAVRMGNGKVYEGIWHLHAHNVAKDAGEPVTPSGYLVDSEDGFVGNDGKFYTRWEANQLSGVRGETIDLMNSGKMEHDPKLAPQAMYDRTAKKKGKVKFIGVMPGSQAEASFHRERDRERERRRREDEGNNT